MGSKISLIIPVYGTEIYLERCIRSVLGQSYKNIEVILVDDCSPGNAEEIIQKFKQIDSRIIYCRHEKNKGLFQARLTGADHATGDYIAFLDSDDYVSCDYYHRLLRSAQMWNADIVIGKTVRELSDGTRFIDNYHDMNFSFTYLEGEEIRNSFWEQEGYNYSWHTIWNKLYSMELWKKARPYYNKIQGHLIMTEDIAYSSVLFYFAKKAATVPNDAIFYCENEIASTNTQHLTFGKFSKNVNDIITVFDFIEEFLVEQNASLDLLDHYKNFRKYYAKMWNSCAKWNFKNTELKQALELTEQLYPKLDEDMEEKDYFFDKQRTKWHDGLEHAKKLIMSDQMEYISFDIFDTLIVRALGHPSDVFTLLNPLFRQLLNTNASFEKVRIEGEQEARAYYGTADPKRQDITLTEIYDYLENFYSIPHATIQQMKQAEIELELEVTSARESAMELYELAKLMGKKVIIISDMYLERETIENLLHKNGYDGYNELFVSSQIGKTKNSGDLFRYVLHRLGCEPARVLHIGDTWRNDIEMAQTCGINTFFFPKTQAVFENKIVGIQTNDCGQIGDFAASDIVDRRAYKKSLGYSSMISLAANKYFDNPYRTFHSQSDFNSDPYFIGYYALGMHLVGICKWLIEEAAQRGYRKLYFMSRDGYLPMKIYEIVARVYPEAPAAEYLYTSRKALMPWILKEPFDFYDMPVEVVNHSPITLMQVLTFCSKNISKNDFKIMCENAGINPEKRFQSKTEYRRFIKLFLSEVYDGEKHEEEKQNCSKYYKRILNDEATVDLGYSGRIQGAVSAAVGRGVDVFFIHSDSKRYYEEKKRFQFQIYTFYDYTPCMSGLIREHLFSSVEGSCIGFRKEKDDVIPVLENEKKIYQDELVVRLLQRGAIDFASSYIEKLGKHFLEIPLKPVEVSFPFEGFLRFAKDVDLDIFSASYFEDMVYGAVKSLSVSQAVKDRYYACPRTALSGDESYRSDAAFSMNLYDRIKDKNVIVKFFIYLFADRENLKSKVSKRLYGTKFAYGFCRKCFYTFFNGKTK